MTERDIIVETQAREFLASVTMPICEADIHDAFKAGFFSGYDHRISEEETNRRKMNRVRKPYEWGKKETLMSMKVGESIEVPFHSEAQVNAYRCSASRFHSDDMGVWSVHKDSKNKIIIITRHA